ncbi:MAG: multiheme c-type cytochrome [Acidobacteriota bacterium]
MRYLAWIAGFLLLLPGSRDATAVESPFVGAKRCKLCHRAIYESWEASVHRAATESLPPAKRAPACLRCHATGPPALPGVQCEACHGAGGNYWPAEIMMDTEKAQRAGLVKPSESVCRRCHATALPGHAASFAMPEGPERERAIH